MSQPDQFVDESNPFSTRFIRPGAIAFVFPPDDSCERLVQRLVDHNWSGQIVGPHGSGKSTLLATLLPALEAAGRRPIVFALHDGDKQLPSGWPAQAKVAGADLIIVDGYEQLGLWSRTRLRAMSRRRRSGLLITVHHDAGLPTVFETRPTPELAVQLAERLLPDCQRLIGREEIEACHAAVAGNLRETLFALYDRYSKVQAAGARQA